MSTDYTILPKRKVKESEYPKSWEERTFFSNYYSIEQGHSKSNFYQYVISIKGIPDDSYIYHLSITSIQHFLREKFGYVAHKGHSFWGNKFIQITTMKNISIETFHTKKDENKQNNSILKKEEEASSFESSEMVKNETSVEIIQEGKDSFRKKHNLEAKIRFTKQICLFDWDEEEHKMKILQILNISLRGSLSRCKMTELGKSGQYYPKKQKEDNELKEVGLQVLRGFKFTLVPLRSKICLQVDVCSRVLQSRSLLRIVIEDEKDFSHYIGETIITKYGVYRTYVIQDVETNLSPQHSFHLAEENKEITYSDFFLEKYGVKIQDLNQPLLKVIKRMKQVHTKDAQGRTIIEKVPEFIYMVPELVMPTGLTPFQRFNPQVMKSLHPITKLTPEQRMIECEKVISEINESKGLIKISHPLQLKGALLDFPKIQYSSVMEPEKNGLIKNRGFLKEPHKFKDWLLVYSHTLSTDHVDADKVVDLLSKASNVYGVVFKKPGFLIVSGRNVKSWKEAIKKDVDLNGTPQIIILLLNSKEESFYGELKRYTTNQLLCPSQFIRKKTMKSRHGPMSAASKIVVQMNCKVGEAPWEVIKGSNYFKDKNFMYGGISVSSGKKGYTLAFVGTRNNQCTLPFSAIKMGIKKKEQISVNALEEIFVNWAKSYYFKNKKPPSVILIYREGMSDHQARAQLEKVEIPALENMVKKIGVKTRTPNYTAQIILVLVNKNIHSRYFKMDGSENNFNNLRNPDSGSIVLDELSINDGYDFHLAAQKVTAGTCTPTLFKVAYDTSEVPQESLINFTFEQCFNYYNWQGAVRVPACLQSAEKMSKLFGESIKETPSVDNPLMKKFFFL